MTEGDEALTHQTGRRLARFSAFVDDSYPPGLDPEILLWRRCTYVVSEAGEVYDAVAGVVGANARKGITHDRDDVMSELLDVAASALAAVEHLSGNDGSAMGLFDARVRFLCERVGITGEQRP